MIVFYPCKPEIGIMRPKFTKLDKAVQSLTTTAAGATSLADKAVSYLTP